MPTRKIVLITIDYPPERGGVARYLGSLVAESKGVIEVLVDTNHEKSGPGVVTSRRLFRNAWPRWFPIIGACRDQKDAVILVSHVFPVGTAAWISRCLGGPEYAVIFHGLDLRRATSLWKRWLLNRIVRRAKTLIVNSEATAGELRKLIPDANPLVITPGVRTPPSGIEQEPKTTPRVISVSRLVSRKGLDIAIRAVGNIQKETPIEYVIIGDGPDLQRLHQVAEESGARVKWISRPSDEKKWSWLASSDVFVLPVRDEGNDIEGFGIVFLEAAVVGIPSIAGRSGGAIEAVVDGETGIVVDPNSVADVEGALRRSLFDETARREMGERAKLRAQTDFQWNERWSRLAAALGVPQQPPDMQKQDIAVVIPCFNHADVLRRTLEGLLAQTHTPAEIVLVDDASMDHPEKIVQDLPDLKIRIIRFDQNRGAPAARNEGARSTTSPLVMFLDADIEMVPSALERLSQELTAHPEASYAYPNLMWGTKPFRSKPFDISALKRLNYIHTSALIRRSDFPGFDESIKKFQDWDLWLTMAEKGKQGVWVDEFLQHVEPRRVGGISKWMPSWTHLIPWPLFGWMPKEIKKYRAAESVIRKKHGI